MDMILLRGFVFPSFWSQDTNVSFRGHCVADCRVIFPPPHSGHEEGEGWESTPFLKGGGSRCVAPGQAGLHTCARSLGSTAITQFSRVSALRCVGDSCLTARSRG